MNAEMDGKVALVTGASRGIGAAVARAFREAGTRVALAARSAEELEWLADGLGAAHGDALAIPTDVNDPAAVEAMVTRVVEVFGRLDYACNNAAGGGHPPTPLAEVPVEAFDSGIAVSLRGVFLSMHAEIPAMLEAGGGAIVNMSSTAGSQAVGGLGTYVAAKAMPLRRVGTPEEVAAAVVWLCSEAAGFVTGTTLTIDGGKLAGTPPFQVKAGPR